MVEGVASDHFRRRRWRVEEQTRAERLHDEYRRKLWDDIKSSTDSFDKYMLTFSSGALGLSVAFLKDVVPLSKAIWVPCLLSSWVAFVLCIMVTLISFRFSIRALENSGPLLDAYYLEKDTDAYNKHLKTFAAKAIDWCAYSGIILFVLGLVFTMMFVGVNIKEAKAMSDNETRTKETPTVKTMDFGCKPVAMAPLEKGTKPMAMTPVPDGTGAGVKPPGMVPAPPLQPPVPAPPAQKPDK